VTIRGHTVAVLCFVVLGVTGAAATAPAAQAAGQEQIASYVVDVTIRPDSSLQVTETIVYDFASEQRRGIFRVVPDRDRFDDTYDRIIRIENVRAASPTGAPADVEVERSGGATRIRIGDPDRTVTGEQTYVIDYSVRGAMNAFDEQDELVWNAIGVDWQVPIERASVTVRAPADVIDGACTSGPPLSLSPCAAASTSGATARFAEPTLAPGEGVTVAVALPVEAVDVPPPLLEARWTPQRAFSVGPIQVVVALLALVGGLAGVLALAWRRGRDRRYVGQVPGLEPPPGLPAPEEHRPLGTGPEGAVEFAPPPDVRPGLVGTLLDERANVLDVTATVIDLAVRGYLRISEIPRSNWLGKADWRIDPVRAADEALLPYERRLLEAFTGRTDTRLSVVAKDAALDLQLVQQDLYRDVVARGWFRGRPDRVRTQWTVLGGLLVVAGAGATYALARWTTFGLTGIALVLAGVTLLLAAPRMPARTGRGSATLARTLGFRTYIRTAEVEQIRFEEREQVFSRYLPYAMVFGEADRWAKSFAAVGFGAAAGVAGAASAPGWSLPWYSMSQGSSFAEFGAAIEGFTVTTAGSLSAAAAAASASSGGSGFSGGGFSGGGFGGGGGGSW
jgi:hypothetical protein